MTYLSDPTSNIAVLRHGRWFALPRHGCIVEPLGPFATEADALAAGEAWLAARLAK